MLRILVLGSAAGGGFPQWNSNDTASRRARSGDPAARPRSQSSIAVTADGKRWVLLNASPDLRQQISERPQLHPLPDSARRSSPISAVVLTNADVDHTAGLLSLRERQMLAVYGHARVLDVLAANTIFNVLDGKFVARRPIALDTPFELSDHNGQSLGITLLAFAVPGKVALWLEDVSDIGASPGDTIGLMLAAPGSRPFFYIPGCAALNPDVGSRLLGAALVFFDGTLWRDDEMIVQGVGSKTGQRMGHMSCSGETGTMAAFASLNVDRKVFIHINNTNPLLLDDSPERAMAARLGWEVAYDGMEIVL
jgi:pyrroloquinoline quinone biosynthesis protein B